MRATGTFTVEAFEPMEMRTERSPQTAVPVAVARMEKRFSGEVSGVSTTIFTYAMNSDVGGYVAMESFQGSLHERTGTFNFTHTATTSGSDRANESFAIVPSSGTGALGGISGAGGIAVEPDGSHRIWFEYGVSD